MKLNRLSSIGLVACVALVATMTAMTLVAHSANAQWQSLFGLLVQRVAEAFTAPPSWNSAGSDRIALANRLYAMGYAAAGVLFTLSFWWRTTSTPRRPALVDAALLALQLVIGVTVEHDLLYVFAAELAIVLPPRRAAAWFAALVLGNIAQSLAIVAALARTDQVAQFGLLEIGLDTVFDLFAFGVAALATLEQRAREKLAVSHGELLATQSLLADTVRTAERQRIARDLHDSIGHHLTALNLHLDLADRQLSGANASLRTARDLSGALLAEVRVVVSAARDDQYIALKQSLQALCDSIPEPRIHLDVQDDLRITSALTAHTLFRCIQEAISNALRHAQAQRLDVVVAVHGARLVATIRDDGRGARGRPEGNGLAGMRERLLALGGVLGAGDLPHGGFQVQLSVPAIEEAR